MSDDKFSGQFKTAIIIYGALIIGQLIFFAIALFIVGKNVVESVQYLDDIFQVLIPILGLLVMILVRSIYNKNLSSVNSNEDVNSKILKYRGFKIFQWALIESVSILSIIGLIITSNYLYAVVFLFMLGFFILIRPSKEQFFNDFKISNDQKNMFSNS